MHDGDRTLVECRARGTFRLQDLKPLVGDNVCIRLTLEDPGSGYIEELLPRKNTLIRPAVANVDQALIIVSLQRPAFHPALLDRFLLWMAWQQVPVLIGLNKLEMPGTRALSGICMEEQATRSALLAPGRGRGCWLFRSGFGGLLRCWRGSAGLGNPRC